MIGPFVITIDFTYLNLTGPCRILDIGCGSGRHLGAAYGMAQASIVGADPNSGDLRQARERLAFHERVGARGRGSHCRLAAASIEHLPFSDQSFDLVIASEVLEHVADVQASIRELVRVLAPRGRLVISVPRCWPETLCWLISPVYRRTPGGHVRIFKVAPLIALVRTHGLHYQRIHWAHSLHVPYWWLKCLAGVERDDALPVRLYHRLLVWDMISRPRVMKLLERLLNPIMGKSVVLYFTKSHV